MNEREKRVFGQYIIVLTIAVSFFIFFTLYIIAYIYFPNFNKPLQFYNLEYLKKNCLTDVEKDILNRKFYIDKKKRGVAEDAFPSYMYNIDDLTTNINFITENYLFSMKAYVYYYEQFFHLSKDVIYHKINNEYLKDVPKTIEGLSIDDAYKSLQLYHEKLEFIKSLKEKNLEKGND